MLVACNLPWIGKENNWSPMTLMNDGVLNVTYASSLSMGAIVGCLIKGETGEFHTYKCIESVPCLAFVLEPDEYRYDSSSFLSKMSKGSRRSSVSRPSVTSMGGKKGILNVSGERIPYEAIQVEILPGVLNVIVPEWLDVTKWKREFNEAYGEKVGTL